MIEGYVGKVTTDQVFGWTFDRDRPEAHLRVIIRCGERVLGSGIANLFRPDLAKAQIGAGDHGFTFLMAEPLTEADLDQIAVAAYLETETEAVTLPRFGGHRPVKASALEPRVRPAAFADDTQYPVLVVGAPRSGTSAVAQSIVLSTSYKSPYYEGHVLDLLMPLQAAVAKFFSDKAAEVEEVERRSMIARVPADYFDAGIFSLFKEAMRRLHSTPRWCDKTPTPEMIWALPTVLRIWPNARVIFMKRRPFDNLASRVRKFRGVSFEAQCLEWVTCMQAWLQVRGEIAGKALELDQQFVARAPQRAAQAIAELLSLPAAEAVELGAMLGRHQPERTGGAVDEQVDTASLGWDEGQWADFERICSPTLQAFGYGRGADYWGEGASEQACVRV